MLVWNEPSCDLDFGHSISRIDNSWLTSSYSTDTSRNQKHLQQLKYSYVPDIAAGCSTSRITTTSTSIRVIFVELEEDKTCY